MVMPQVVEARRLLAGVQVDADPRILGPLVGARAGAVAKAVDVEPVQDLRGGEMNVIDLPALQVFEEPLLELVLHRPALHWPQIVDEVEVLLVVLARIGLEQPLAEPGQIGDLLAGHVPEAVSAGQPVGETSGSMACRSRHGEDRGSGRVRRR